MTSPTGRIKLPVMNKLATVTVVALALLLTGCSATQASNESVAGAAKFAASADDVTEATGEPIATETAEPTVDVTAPGEVCDPQNLNDLICAAFYPEQVVLNLTAAPRAQEPLASMTDEQKIQLAHAACDTLAAGGTKDTVTLVTTDNPDALLSTWNNNLVFTAGTLGYCNDYIEGENFQWGVNEYRSMGEQAAKESFADGVPITATR